MRVLLAIAFGWVLTAMGGESIIREPQVLPAASNYTSLGRVDRPFKRIDADRYFRQGVELLPGSGGNWQPASLNLTNWGSLSTNVLTNYVRFANLVAQTNTIWQRLTNGTQTVAATWTSVDTEETNILMSYTPASDSMMRFDYVNTWAQSNYIGTDQVICNFLFWTDPTGQFIQQNLYGQIDDYLNYMPNSPGTGPEFQTISNRVFMGRRSILLSVKGGTSMILSNYVRNSINGPDEPFGTNVFQWSLSMEQELVSLRYQ